MEDTKDRPGPERATTEQQEGFDAGRLRTITDMRRSRDDRMLAGVCAGAAKYLNVDPVIIRVVIAVLTFVGLSGLILYLAAWFFLPADDTDQSIAADWFNLDKNEEQVRVIGLVGAAVLAALAIVGDSQWAWWGLPWVLLPLAILYWFFVVRPRRRATDAPMASVVRADADDTAVLPAGSTDPGSTKVAMRPERPPGSSALTGLTLSVAAIAVAIAVLVAESTDAHWTIYPAVALAVITAGVLVGMFFGRPGPLILIGLIVAVVLVIGSVMSSNGVGDKSIRPLTASGVDADYEHGMGVLRFDLTSVDDPEQLLGSTIRLENGVGEIKVTVPRELNVAVDAQVDAGEIRAFGSKTGDTDATLVRPPEDPDAPALTLHIRENLGGIEVIER